MQKNIDSFQGSLAVPQRSSDDDVIDLGAVFRTLWISKFTIISIMLLAMAVGIYQAYIGASSRYTSTAVLMLDSREEQIVDLESVIGGLSKDTTAVNTEVEVLRSRSLLGKVITELNLTADPEFNRFIRPETRSDQIKALIKEKVFLTFGQEPPEDPPISETRVREGAIDLLLSAISIANIPQSLVFQVQVETSSPDKSALIADTILQTYILNQIEVKFEATEQATSWLTDRVAGLRQNLEETENKLKSFRSQTDLISPEILDARSIQLKELRDRISNTQTSLAEQTELLAKLLAAQTREEQAEISGTPQLQQLLARVDEPSIARSFDERFAQVLQELRRDVSRAELQLQALTVSGEQIAAEIEDQSADLITLQQLMREAEANRLLYEHFLSRLKETSVQQGLQQADSRILSNAVVPVAPSAPRKPLIIAVSTMLGIILGIAFVLLRELRQQTYRNSTELERATGLSVVGQIPVIPSSRKRKNVIDYLRQNQTSAAAEAMRNLRTTLLMLNIENPPQVFMTCSSTPGEGKTTTALALAHSLGSVGKKVCLIEGDMRRKVFSNYMPTAVEHGLTAVLRKGVSLKDAIVKNEELGISLVLADDFVENAGDILSSSQFEEMMNELRDMFDFVVIDAPPVLVVPDAKLISQFVDTVVFLVRWDSTKQTVVSAALQELRKVGAPPIGLVLNLIRPRRMRQYGFGEEYGAYSSYGNEYYNT